MNLTKCLTIKQVISQYAPVVERIIQIALKHVQKSNNNHTMIIIFHTTTLAPTVNIKYAAVQ